MCRAAPGALSLLPQPTRDANAASAPRLVPCTNKPLLFPSLRFLSLHPRVAVFIRLHKKFPSGAEAGSSPSDGHVPSPLSQPPLLPRACSLLNKLQRLVRRRARSKAGKCLHELCKWPRMGFSKPLGIPRKTAPSPCAAREGGEQDPAVSTPKAALDPGKEPMENENKTQSCP